MILPVFQGCKSKTPKHNIVVILVDTLRADHTSMEGYRRDTTPNMKRIAADSLYLKNFFVNSPWTKPSVATFFTGLYPTCHGSRVGHFEQINKFYIGSGKMEILNSKNQTIAETLKENGYKTYGFVTNYHMTPKFGYHQGYDVYDFDADGSYAGVVNKTDKRSMDAAMKVLGEPHDKPVFIWCHLMGVHAYSHPPEFNRFKPEGSTPIPPDAFNRFRMKHYSTLEEAVSSYDNSILYADHLIGEFFDFVREKAPGTLLIIVSDHGEEFYEHQGFEHNRTLYNEILKVPCIIHGPGVPAGAIPGFTDSMDFFPTVLNYAGIRVPEEITGNILFADNSITTEGKDEIYAEQHNPIYYRRFSLITKTRKLVMNQHKPTGKIELELYHHPLKIEAENKIDGEDRKTIQDMSQRIHHQNSLNKKYFKKHVGQPTLKDLTKEDLDHLRSLGYVE